MKHKKRKFFKKKNKLTFSLYVTKLKDITKAKAIIKAD